MWNSDTLIRLVEVGFVLVVAMLLLVPTLYAFNWLFRHLVRIANPGQLTCHYGSPQAVSACPQVDAERLDVALRENAQTHKRTNAH